MYELISSAYEDQAHEAGDPIPNWGGKDYSEGPVCHHPQDSQGIVTQCYV